MSEIDLCDLCDFASLRLCVKKKSLGMVFVGLGGSGVSLENPLRQSGQGFRSVSKECELLESVGHEL